MSQYLENCRAWQKRAQDGRAHTSFGFTNQLIDKVAELEDKLEQEQKKNCVYKLDNDRLLNKIKVDSQVFVDTWADLQMKNMWLASRINHVFTREQIEKAPAPKDESISKRFSFNGIADVTIRVNKDVPIKQHNPTLMRLSGDLSDLNHLHMEIEKATERYKQYVEGTGPYISRKDIHIVNISIEEHAVFLQYKPEGKSKEQIMDEMYKVLAKADVHMKLAQATRK